MLAVLATTLSIVPLPTKVDVLSGELSLGAAVTISNTGALANERKHLGMVLDNIGIKTGKGTRISLKIDQSLARLGDEGYTLNVNAGGISIAGPSPKGVFYGIQTLRQLIPIGGTKNVPFVNIEDSPRFKWRGSHMDVARHFMPKEFIFKYLDVMAMLKLNTFHWHLTDDQGWRIEIKKYPKLTSVGGFRKDTMLVYSPPKFTGEPHGGFYTQEDVKEVIRYAAERHITVVPEIEMPGHAQAAIAAYPELGHVEGLEVGTTWGVIKNVFNVRDTTIQFLKDVLDEVITLFPSEFIHIGGDECPKDQWKTDPFAQAKMKKLGLKDEHELQSWFIRQMDQHLDSRGRRLIGWSEILEGGLAPGAALMVWLGDDGALQAVSSGHDVVMAQTSHMYFDYYQADKAKEPHAIGGFLPIEKVYQYEPILPKMTAEQGKHVMGVQYQLWSEYIRTPEHMEYMAFPRACALAEVAWSSKEARNWDSFRSRLPAFLEHLKAKGVNFRPLGNQGTSKA
ncbi:MAG TPA: beta-N-acetylhexosaminidase [Fimbriimonadaceae bacterium]|nr:beta-N-acetylhexosaminidase [Fimbriimonadaceae bacterium]